MIHSRKKALTKKKTPLGPDRLSTLSDQLLKHSLFRFLGPSGGARLAETSHRLENMFKDLPESKNAILEFASNLRQLLLLVARGKKHEAELLISQRPHLLLAEGDTTDYTFYYRDGQYHQRKHKKRTALQIALGAGDVNLYDQSGKLLDEGMVEMILRYLKKRPDSEAIIAKQIQGQFPPGWEADEEKKHATYLTALHEINYAIKNSSEDKECEAAILKFKNALAPQEEITIGKHWDAKLLLAAFEIGYSEYFYDAPRKDDLFYNVVISYIENLAPAHDAMAMAQGLYYILIQGKNFNRDLKINFGTGSYYLSSSTGLRYEFDSWVDCYHGVVRPYAAKSPRRPVEYGVGAGWLRPIFEAYVGAKTTVLRQFITPSDFHISSFKCAVM